MYAKKNMQKARGEFESKDLKTAYEEEQYIKFTLISALGSKQFTVRFY